MDRIHPTAIVSKEARLASDVEVGAYTLIGPHVRIGSGTRLGSHVVVEGHTQIGERCRLFSGVVIGGPAQVRQSEEMDSSISIGDDNIFREHVTIHSSMKKGGRTVLGHRNFLMAGAHIAHDCVLGDDITIANGTALGGHVIIEDRVMIGGLVGVHQHVRVGRLAMIGGVTKLTMDAVPFSMQDGRPAVVHGINVIGMRRAGYTSSSIAPIKQALKMLVGTRANMTRMMSEVEKIFGENADVRHILDFIHASKRGVARSSSAADLVQD